MDPVIQSLDVEEPPLLEEAGQRAELLYSDFPIFESLAKLGGVPFDDPSFVLEFIEVCRANDNVVDLLL